MFIAKLQSEQKGKIYLGRLKNSIIAILFLSSCTAFAKKACSDFFEDYLLAIDIEFTLDELDAHNSRLENITSEISRLYSDKPSVNQTIKALVELSVKASDQLGKLEDKALKEKPIKYSEVELVERLIENLERQIFTVSKAIMLDTEFEHESQKIPWEQLIHEPGLIIANKNYKLSQHDGNSLKINFSEKVVSEVLNSKNMAYQNAIKKALSDAQKGVFGAHYFGTGIIRLIDTDGFVEIRSVGKDGGRFRFGGYIHEHVLYIVHWANAGQHSAKNYKAHFRAGIARGKTRRGH